MSEDSLVARQPLITKPKSSLLRSLLVKANEAEREEHNLATISDIGQNDGLIQKMQAVT